MVLVECKQLKTSLTVAIPHWSCGGNDVSSQQSVWRDRSAWKTSLFQEVPKNWLSIYQWEKSLLLVKRQCPSQRVSVNTDEINELAQSRKYSRQVTSPPLHLYTNDLMLIASHLLPVMAKPNWSCAGNDIYLQQSVGHNRSVFARGCKHLRQLSHHHSFFKKVLKHSVRCFAFLLLCFSPPSFANQNTDHDKIILSTALWEGVDPALVHAVIRAESNYNHLAVSHANAQGLMQLIPATAERFNVKDVFDPSQNVTGGTKYLRWLLKRFKGDMRLALAGYNAGEGNVDKYKGIPPFKETQQYVKKVMRFYRKNKGLPPINATRVLLAKKKVSNQQQRLSVVKKPVRKTTAHQKLASHSYERAITSGAFHRISSLTIPSNRQPLVGYSRVTATRRLQ